jgi:hypothetical protein
MEYIMKYYYLLFLLLLNLEKNSNKNYYFSVFNALFKSLSVNFIFKPLSIFKRNFFYF